MLKYLLIAIGGGTGSVLRFLLHSWVQRAGGISFPFGTLAVNVLGCFAIGCLTGIFSAFPQMREEYRLGLTVGVLGGFTTFSTFGFETFKLLEEGATGLALLNVLASCVIGLLAVAIGYSLTGRLIAG